MIEALLLSLAAAVDAPDPCRETGTAAVEPADPATAAIYRAVGDDERASGNAAAAQVAYREALRHDPNDAAARLGLEALCREGRRAAAEAGVPSRQDDFDRGVELMQQGDRAGAIAAFEAWRALEPDAAAALLEGICRYELGDDRGARPLFEEARRAPKFAGTALFFLGLIAMHDDEDARAASLFSAAAGRDAGIASAAASLRRLARRDGRVVASALAESGFDSNVELAPDGSANRAGAGDAHGGGVAGLFLRPVGSSGPYLRATGQYRKQLRLTSYDLGDAAAAVGLRVGRNRRSLNLEYAYDYLSLGGGPYLSRHRALALGRVSRGPFALLATYVARFETFLTQATEAYSGIRQDAEAAADWQLVSLLVVGLGYRIERDAVRDPALSYFEHGPIVALRFGLGGPARIAAEARLTLRDNDAFDPDLGARRQDTFVDGSVLGEYDVADNWTVRALLTGRRAFSNVPDFRYDKLTMALAIVYTVGVL
jgi:tetratricopeptide (TPR) repeat protein